MQHAEKFAATDVINGGIVATPAPTCLNCGAQGSVLHRDVQDSAFGVPGSWSIRQCSNRACRLCWVDPRPREEELSKLYTSYWTHAGDNDEMQPLAVAVDQPRRSRVLAKRLIATLLFWRRDAILSDDYYLSTRPVGRLLDVGCGTGEFAARMAAKGWDVVGIDFDEAAVRNARRYPGVDARVGDLVSQQFPEASFDAILLSNVIEHLPDPQGTFTECLRVLRPSGRLVMVTPNTEALGHARFGRHWRGLEPPRHLAIFNGPTLRQFAQRAGFTKLRTFSTPGSLAAIRYIIEGSQDAARAAGEEPPRASPVRMMLIERVLDTFGIARGDWSVLIAERTAGDRPKLQYKSDAQTPVIS